MKAGLVLGCVLMAGSAHAQASGDNLDKLRACSTLERSERLACLDRLAGVIGARPPSDPPAAARPVVTEWIVSETTSPLDYSPVAVARSTSIDQDGTGLQLAIRCRAGTSELVVSTSPSLARRPEDYLVTYSVNGSAPVVLPLAAATTGPGFALRTDPARLLGTLPATGSMALRLAAGNDPALETRYALEQLKAVTLRLAAPCRWSPSTLPRRP